MHLFESGFCMRQPSWHRLETLISDYPGDWDQARVLAGLEWDPVAEPVYALRGIDAGGNADYRAIKGFTRIARSDTGATLSVLSDRYQTIDHGEMGAIVEAVLEQENVKWETAGSLAGGRQSWALAYLDEPITLAGDNSPTYPYLVILNRHDGRGACKVLSTNVRVVCANTFSAAEMEGDRSGAVFSFVHGRSWRDRIEEARDAVRGVRRAHRVWIQMAESLLATPIDGRQSEIFVTEFIPSPPEGVISERVRNNIDQARDVLRGILASPTTAEVAGSAYGLVQAAGEYLDHYRAYRSMETYVNRQLLAQEPLKRRAMTLALAAAES